MLNKNWDNIKLVAHYLNKCERVWEKGPYGAKIEIEI